MWLSLFGYRDRFSLDELRYLIDQLQQVQIVNDNNKDHVIEDLRSVAELVTYGDQHDPTFFEFLMEKQIMGEFVRILKVSTTISVALQLLQTLSIMIQNFKSEHSIYYIFSNEHINNLITYPFDFCDEELLSYYISFLRAISGKLNKDTISLLVKTQNDEVVSFPLYKEAIRFAFHEENMVRIAVRAITLNVYHVGDECVNKYVTTNPLVDYFSNLVECFKKQCINFDGCVSEAAKNPSVSDPTSCILAEADEIEDTLYYLSDIILSGVPDLGRLISDNILLLLIFPLLLPSLKREFSEGSLLSATTSLYLLCCILRIVKAKDLSSSICATLFCTPESFFPMLESKPNGDVSICGPNHESQQMGSPPLGMQEVSRSLRVTVSFSSFQMYPPEDISLQNDCNTEHLALRDILLSYVIRGHDVHVVGSLNVLTTLLQIKELDESMLDALGLPNRNQHKKKLLKALMGEGSDEEKLFFSESSSAEDGICSELEGYMQRLKDRYGLCCYREPEMSPQMHRCQVLDALISLFFRSDVSAETLWVGGWLLRQLLPYSVEELSSHHLELLKELYKNCINCLLEEITGIWCDVLIAVVVDAWKKCKRAIEASSPHKDPKCILLPPQTFSSEGESSFSAGKRMYKMVKVFVLSHQIRIFCAGETVPEQPSLCSSLELPVNARAKSAVVDALGPEPGTEISLVDAVPCKIAFERGKQRHLCFMAISRGVSGWLLLAEEIPIKQGCGVVRAVAPLAGSNPTIDKKHPKWLHLCIRPSTLPFADPAKLKSNALVDGRWTLAFRDEQCCKSARSMILEEMHLQSTEVEKRLHPLLNLDRPVNA